MDYDPNNPLASYEEKVVEKYLDVESQYMPAENYYCSNKAILRKIAVHFIVEVWRESWALRNDAFIPYLAMNYFDRYISRDHPLPNVGKRVQDDAKFVTFCCLTVAWKMRDKKFDIPQLLILLMELKILSALNWRTRPVNGLCFVVLLFPSCSVCERRFINQMIIEAQGAISFTLFKPSVIATSAIITAACLYEEQFPNLKSKILCSKYKKHFVKEEIRLCASKFATLCHKRNFAVERATVEAASSSIVWSFSSVAKESSERLHRIVKNPLELIKEIERIVKEQEQTKDVPEKDRKEIRKAPEEEIWVNEEQDSDPVPMKFRLQWVTNNKEDVTIDSPVFRDRNASRRGSIDMTILREKNMAELLRCCCKIE